MPFAVLMTWRETTNHVHDCYLCCDSVSDFLAINKPKLVYPNLNSAMRPILHDDNLPVSESPENGLALVEQMERETFLHLKTFSALQTINKSQGIGLQNQNNLISRN
jgi:hypothetical protein